MGPNICLFSEFSKAVMSRIYTMSDLAETLHTGGKSECIEIGKWYANFGAKTTSYINSTTGTKLEDTMQYCKTINSVG